jgi:hypothetical protein
MTKNPKRKTPPHAGAPAEPVTLAEVMAALDRPCGLSGTRLRDLKSATKRVRNLVGKRAGRHSPRYGWDQRAAGHR